MFFVDYKDCEFLRFFKAKLIHNREEFLTNRSDWNIFHTNFKILIFNILKT
jgi:hypothetical protein